MRGAHCLQGGGTLNDSAQMTPDEAARAIYIDFEGRKDEHPAVLGLLYAEGRAASPDRVVLRQDVIDRALWPTVGWSTFSWVYRYDTDARSLAQSVQELLQRARHQDRLIVAWSEHDLRVVSSYLPNAA